MDRIYQITEKRWVMDLLLMLSGFGIYFFYFHHVFLNINSVMCGTGRDFSNNYFSYASHVVNDEGLIHFAGMNFPFGDHFVYTDCQPLLVFILRLFPAAHPFLIGILHALMFGSFIATPIIFNRILNRLGIEKFSSFFISLAVILLSPQFLRIHVGHFALSYAFVIPLSFLLLLNLFDYGKIKTAVALFLYNTMLFFIHPYLGFGVSLFCFMSLFFLQLLKYEKVKLKANIYFALLSGLFPMVFFKLFIGLTDGHVGRPTEPSGINIMISGPGSLFVPGQSPFKGFLEDIFRFEPTHWEGYCYLGISLISFAALFLLFLPFMLKKIKVKKEMMAMFMACLIMLVLSFGAHNKILSALHMETEVFNQLRASGRFSWFFYYMLPLFLIPVFYDGLKTIFDIGKMKKILIGFSVLFFLFNFMEADAVYKNYLSTFWKTRNYFNKDLLNHEERAVLKSMTKENPQAIIPLPLFHQGTEMYDRLGHGNSMVPAYLYSYHSKVPILSAVLARPSITETEDMIQLLNPYKGYNRARSYLSDKPFLIIRTTDELLPDEERIIPATEFLWKSDSSEIGYISKKALISKKINAHSFYVKGQATLKGDSSDIIYLRTNNKTPFVPSKMENFEKIFVLDSGKITSGSYIVSFHYHYKERVFKSIACNLIVTKAKENEYNWIYNIPVRILSGFYDGFGVFEYKIDIEKQGKYEFIIKGNSDRTYKVSDFMLRPAKTTVISILGRDTSINNFPR